MAQFEDLAATYRVDSRIEKKIHTLSNYGLIVIDETSLLSVSHQTADALYRVGEACYERSSIALSSNLYPASFDPLVPKTLATATVDRLLHHAHVVQTSGGSVRMTQALSSANITT